MYVIVGMDCRRLRNITAVRSDPISKTDQDCVCAALDWARETDNVSFIEVWDENEMMFVCKIEV